MKYAVIKTSGTQIRVSEGEEIELPKLGGEEGKKLTFDQVLLLVNGEKSQIGQPLVKQAVVEGRVLSQFKGKKIRVATYKAKSRYRRVRGFRPQLTRVKIEKISLSKSKNSASSKKTASKA